MASELFERALDLVERAAAVDEFALGERQRRLLARSHRERRSETTVDVALDLFFDTAAGRGAVRLSVTPRDLPRLGALIDGAGRDARSAVGPSWRMPPAAAPALVPLRDPAVADSPADTLDALEAQLREASADTDDWTLGAELAIATVVTNRGLRASFEATELVGSARVRDRGMSTLVGARRRRTEEFDLARRALRGRARCRTRASAGAAETGIYDAVLRADALEHWGTGWGLLGPLASQATADAPSRGTARYLPGQNALAGRGDPITLWSDGALPFGLLSRPFGELGEPVRRFPLIENNRAVDVGRGARVASVTGEQPNGGVRNLVLTPGTHSLDELLAPADAPVLEVRSWSWLRTDANTGTFLAEVETGFVHRTGAKPQPVAGNLVSGDVFAAWGNALLGDRATFLGWYSGPSAVKLRGIAVST